MKLSETTNPGPSKERHDATINFTEHLEVRQRAQNKGKTLTWQLDVDNEDAALVGSPTGSTDSASHARQVPIGYLNTHSGQFLVAFNFNELFLNSRHIKHCERLSSPENWPTRWRHLQSAVESLFRSSALICKSVEVAQLEKLKEQPHSVVPLQNKSTLNLTRNIIKPPASRFISQLIAYLALTVIHTLVPWLLWI